jgi:hypothetical protein
MRKRISLLALASGGLAVGLLMLFLVANRNSIYLGSEITSVRNPLDFLERWSSNEYLVGSAYVRYANVEGVFYGVRELTHLIARFLPNFVWPDIYVELPAIFGYSFNLWRNTGVDILRVAQITGWTPSVGAAEGFAASLWLEFGVFAFPVAFLIGMLYGRVWLAARESIPARLVYLLMVALSIYLIMQNLDPWLYRLILLGTPAYVVGRMISFRRVETPRGRQQPAGGRRGRPRVSSPTGGPYSGPPGRRLGSRGAR